MTRSHSYFSFCWRCCHNLVKRWQKHFFLLLFASALERDSGSLMSSLIVAVFNFFLFTASLNLITCVFFFIVIFSIINTYCFGLLTDFFCLLLFVAIPFKSIPKQKIILFLYFIICLIYSLSSKLIYYGNHLEENKKRNFPLIMCYYFFNIGFFC